MAVKKLKNWQEAFMKPLNFEEDFIDAPVEQYDARRCYPEVLDCIPVEDRHKEGYFFADEVTSKNADEVRFIRVRDVEVEEFYDDFYCKPVPWTHPGVDLPNLEKIIGDVDFRPGFETGGLDRLQTIIGGLYVEGVDVTLPSLMYVGQQESGGYEIRVRENSRLDCPSLVLAGAVASDGIVKMNALEECRNVKLAHCSFEFDSLKRCKDFELNDPKSFSFPSLESVDRFHIYGGAEPFSFPSLAEVDSYLVMRGKGAGISAPVLTKVGGLDLEGRPDARFSFPELAAVGGAYPEKGGGVRYFGGADLISGVAELPKLRTINGDLEYCHGMKADLPVLKNVHGDLDVNCGHWISVGPSARGSDYPNVERRPVKDKSVRDFELPALVAVDGRFEIHDNTRLSTPVLKSVGGVFAVGKNCDFKSTKMVSCERLVTKDRTRFQQVKSNDKGLSM